MWSKDLLLKMKRNIHLAAVSLPDEDAAETPELFPAWAVDQQYTAGQRVQYEGQLFRCEQSHTSQEDWTPDLTPSLWTLVAATGEIPVWRQPTGAQDAYMIGDKVHYPGSEDPVYVSIIDNNVWAPDVTGWQIYE